MPRPSSPALAQCLQYLAGVMRADTRSDSELLDRFTEARDEAAFAALVGRYAALVWQNCRRVLGPTPDAEDAFQAVFLALARKSGAVRGDALAGWLYRVSQRVSLDCRRALVRRLRHEARAADRGAGPAPSGPSDDELVVREELARLPERLRVPLVLYYLDGKTQAETGRLLGVSDRAVAQRIEQAIAHLRKRLGRRGLVVTGATLGTCLGRATAAHAFPDGLLHRVVAAAADGRAPAAVADLAARATAPRSGPWIAGGLGVLGSVCGAALLFAAGRPEASVAPPPVHPLAVAARVPDPPPGPHPAEPWAVFAGTVTDANGRPVADARVSVLGRSWNQNGGGLRDEVVAEGAADANGRYRLSVTNPVPGEVGVVWLSVCAPGVRTVAAVPVAGGIVPADIPIRLAPGRVSGRVFGPDGNPLAGATVRVVRFGGAAFEPTQPDHAPLPAHVWPPPVATGPDGRFSFSDLDPTADLRVSVVHPASGTASVLDLSGGQPARSNLEVRLPSARRFSGRVTAADTGRPVPNVQVVVDFQHVAGAPPLTRSVRTGADGRFSLGVPTAPRWSVVVSSPPVPYLAARRSVPLPVGTGEVSEEFVLERGAVVRGRVTDAGTGEPVLLAKVRFFPRAAPGAAPGVPTIPGTTTGPDGRFALAVPRGEGVLTATAPDADYVPAAVDPADTLGRPFAAHAATVLAAGDDPERVSFKLERGRPVRGTVALPDGRPVADGWVWCHHLIGGRDLQTPLALAIKDGRFAVPGCRPGQAYTLVLADRTFRYGTVARVTCSDKSHAVVLGPTGTATVEVRDGADRPAAGAVLGVEVGLPGAGGPDDDPEPTRWVPLSAGGPVGADGQRHLPGLVPGARYRVGVNPGRNGSTARTILTVPANGHQQATLVLPHPAEP
jgi:RNA polymerase sigma factor (sigma-70 family)